MTQPFCYNSTFISGYYHSFKLVLRIFRNTQKSWYCKCYMLNCRKSCHIFTIYSCVFHKRRRIWKIWKLAFLWKTITEWFTSVLIWQGFLNQKIKKVKFLHKTSRVKVAWYMFRVKGMHSGSPLNPCRLHEARQTQATYIKFLIKTKTC